MIDILDKKFLENKFAEDFASPYYPILADMYLSEGDIIRARKVCEVGLEYDSSNIDGRFVFAKVAIAENKLSVAEKLLKQVVAGNPAHFVALRLLINLEFQLNRSHKTISHYVKILLNFMPADNEALDWLNKINGEPILLSNNKGLSDQKKQQTDEPNTSLGKVYDVEESMATFTMVYILKSQKHYQQALSVLDMLNNKGLDANKISHYKKEIIQLIKTESAK